MQLGKKIKKVLYVLPVKVTGAVFSLLMSILIARNIGSEGAGLFYVGLQWLMVISVLIRYGYDNTIIRYARTENSYMTFVIQRIRKRGLYYSLAIGLLLLFIGLTEARIKYEVELRILTIFALMIMPHSMIYILGGYANGKGEVTKAFLLHTTLVPTLTTGLLIIIDELTVTKVAAIYLMSIIIVYVLAEKISGCTKRISKIDLHKEYIIKNSAQDNFKTSILNIVNQSVPIFLSSYFLPIEKVGEMAIALRMSISIGMIFMVINAIQLPIYSRIKDKQKIKKQEKIFTYISTVATVIPSGILLFFFEEIINLYGPQFKEIYLILAILLVAQCINAMGGFPGAILIMNGGEKTVRKSTAYMLSINILLGVTLCYFYGLVGLGIAYLIGILFHKLFLNYNLKRWYYSNE